MTGYGNTFLHEAFSNGFLFFSFFPGLTSVTILQRLQLLKLNDAENGQKTADAECNGEQMEFKIL